MSDPDPQLPPGLGPPPAWKVKMREARARARAVRTEALYQEATRRYFGEFKEAFQKAFDDARISAANRRKADPDWLRRPQEGLVWESFTRRMATALYRHQNQWDLENARRWLTEKLNIPEEVAADVIGSVLKRNFRDNSPGR